MIPNKELQELAQALKRSAEYNEMMQLRRHVLEHPRFGRQMLMFEREHARLYSLGLAQAEAELRQKKLYAEYRALLAEEEVKRFIESTRAYQRMVSESIAYLTRLLETNRVY
jgi:cell fate (sporulation/competence/biofilm development) regulator YlbF (YheA/YmcA/DUF963 family)